MAIKKLAIQRETLKQLKVRSNVMTGLVVATTTIKPSWIDACPSQQLICRTLICHTNPCPVTTSIPPTSIPTSGPSAACGSI